MGSRALAAVFALLPSSVIAQPRTVTWEAPGECPDRDAVLARFTAVTRAAGRELGAHARVHREGARWALHLETDDGAQHGERDLSADTCAELVDAAVLILTLALDGTGDTPPTPPAAPIVVRAPTVPPVTSARARFGLRLLAGVEVGALPTVAPTVSLGASWQRGLWRVGLDAAWLARGRVERAAGVGADLDAARVTLRGCVVSYARRVELRGCAGLDLGVMWGTPFGVRDAVSGSAPWFSARAGLEGAWNVWRGLSLLALFEGSALLDGPTFALHDGTTLYSLAPNGMLAQAGAEIRW